jgi:hypothetical protein
MTILDGWAGRTAGSARDTVYAMCNFPPAAMY